MKFPKYSATDGGEETLKGFPYLLLNVAFLGLILSVLIISSYLWPLRNINVIVDGYDVHFQTYEAKVEDVLRRAGIELEKEDYVTPDAAQQVGKLGKIIVRRAVPVDILADGMNVRLHTAATSVDQSLREAGVILTPSDLLVTSNGHSYEIDGISDGYKQSPTSRGSNRVEASAYSPITAPLTFDVRQVSTTDIPSRPSQPIEVEVHRAVPITVSDGGVSFSIYSTKRTLRECFASEGIYVHSDDTVYPDLGSPVSSGMHIFLRRAKELTLIDGKKKSELRTTHETVGEVLNERKIQLSEMDRVSPSLDAKITKGMCIEIIRVGERFVTDSKPISFETKHQPDPELEIDQQHVMQQGRIGLRNWTTRVVYENGEEVSRNVEREWVDPEPVNHIVGYGTKIVVREIDTPQGTLSYWRKMRVFATSYDARHGGKSRDDPGYGYTATGMKAERGVIAIDPTVIPFYTKMYVPGYGIGVAGDTGGAIKGKWIDLCYDEYETGQWTSRWVDIYLLTPVPPPDRIRWTLP